MNEKINKICATKLVFKKTIIIQQPHRKCEKNPHAWIAS